MTVERENLERRIKGIYMGSFEDLPTETQLKLLDLFAREKTLKIISAFIVTLGALLIALKISGLTEVVFSNGDKNFMLKSVYPGIIIAVIGLLFAVVSTNLIKSTAKKMTKKQ
jgi:hypothetical protein